MGPSYPIQGIDEAVLFLDFSWLYCWNRTRAGLGVLCWSISHQLLLLQQPNRGLWLDAGHRTFPLRLGSLHWYPSLMLGKNGRSFVSCFIRHNNRLSWCTWRLGNHRFLRVDRTVSRYCQRLGIASRCRRVSCPPICFYRCWLKQLRLVREEGEGVLLVNWCGRNNPEMRASRWQCQAVGAPRGGVGNCLLYWYTELLVINYAWSAIIISDIRHTQKKRSRACSYIPHINFFSS